MGKGLDRYIEIEVLDQNGARVAGASVTFLVNGKPFAKIPSTRDRNPTFQIGDHHAIIGVFVEYGTHQQSVTLAQNQDSWAFELPPDVVFPQTGGTAQSRSKSSAGQRGSDRTDRPNETSPVELGILHITDLHTGQHRHDDHYPEMLRGFLADLEVCHSSSGPWDVVLFTGDLAFSGKKQQFVQVDSFLNDLRKKLDGIGSGNAVFLAVPGNHDLVRPPEIKPEAVVLANMTTLEHGLANKIWDEILDKNNSSYRRSIVQTFKEYEAWWSPWAQRAEAKLSAFRRGLLPGEFSATIEKGGCRFGVVGLNSTFLQISGANYDGRLAIHVRQFNKLMPSNNLEWFDTLDAAVLMTHQPPSWLSEENRKTFFHPMIARSGRFALHLCGHLHLAR
jgi:predicted MPP superfamily phosphohydrolase